jgi:hypothetical protein
MKTATLITGILIGVMIGLAGTAFCLNPAVVQRRLQPQTVMAGSNDRFEDYIMCTGAVSINGRTVTDGVWVLDHRNNGGKLLGTVIDRTAGKIIGWAELDLTREFGIPAKQPVHFMMTTGNIAQGQAALYVAETNSGKFGVYTLGPDPTGAQAGVVIRRHDLTTFRRGN